MSKHDKILGALFTDPPPANIRWRDIESLLSHLGAKITQGHGSRVRVELRGRRAVFHRPHPQPTANRPVVRSVKVFLENAGIRP